jgi:hypothetical protein
VEGLVKVVFWLCETYCLERILKTDLGVYTCVLLPQFHYACLDSTICNIFRRYSIVHSPTQAMILYAHSYTRLVDGSTLIEITVQCSVCEMKCEK